MVKWEDGSSVGFSVAQVLYLFILSDNALASAMSEVPRLALVQYFETKSLHQVDALGVAHSARVLYGADVRQSDRQYARRKL